jgi:hypothetical protein
MFGEHGGKQGGEQGDCTIWSFYYMKTEIYGDYNVWKL